MAERIRVYAWEFPVRLTHWVNVLSILTLSATGIYIGAPFMHAVRAEQYVMGYVRVAHFIAGYAFLMSMLIRIYWAFMGNRYASWRVWFPFSGQRFSDLMDAVKFYAFLSRRPPYAVGHTALAGLVYFVMFLVFAWQIFSGFALYGQAQPPGTLWVLLGGWLLGMMDLQSVRLLHHLGMYAIFAFVLVHVYISWWLDTVERNGVIGSIFGGYKFVTGKEWE